MAKRRSAKARTRNPATPVHQAQPRPLPSSRPPAPPSNWPDLTEGIVASQQELDSQPSTSQRTTRPEMVAGSIERALSQLAEKTPAQQEPMTPAPTAQLADGCIASELFFAEDLDSLAPVANISPEEAAPASLLETPEVSARRARLRRLVGTFLALAAVLFATAVSKQVLTSNALRTRGWIATADAAVKVPAKGVAREARAAVAAPTVKVSEPASVSGAEPATPEPMQANATDTQPSAATEAPSSAQSAVDSANADPAEAAKLRKNAESLLNRGKLAPAIEASQAAIAADPTEALPYLLLGSALQSSGKWKDGVEAYSECVRHATKGPINECRAMGGHK